MPRRSSYSSSKVVRREDRAKLALIESAEVAVRTGYVER